MESFEPCLDRRDREYDYKRDDGRRGGDRDKRDDRKRHWDKREPSRREDREGKYTRDVDTKDRSSQSGPPSAHPGESSGSMSILYSEHCWKTNKKAVQHLPSVLASTQTLPTMRTRTGKLWMM